MDAIQNTNTLYDITEELELDTSIKYPILYGSRDADSKKFTETVETMFAEKVESGEIPGHQVEAFRTAIDEEMRVFRKLNMDGFMLSMSEILRWCRDNGMALCLPLGMTTKVVCKHNLRNLIDMSHQRMCRRAYHEYRDLFIDVGNALRSYSDEWKFVVENYFMPKCIVNGFCNEKYTCGMMPKKDRELR